MKVKIFLMGLALIFGKTAIAGGGFTGGSSGGLGDDFSIILSPGKKPWFVGPKPVSYCIEGSKEFSVSDPAILKNLVKESLLEWTRALSKLSGVKPGERASDRLMLSMNFEEAPACDKDTELKFYFGVINEAVEEMLKVTSGIPIGYAWLEDSKREQGRGRGIIWLSPDREGAKYVYKQGHGAKPLVNWWSTSVALPIVLKHELGHIFALPHIPGTIMSAYSHNLLGIPKRFEEDYRDLSPQMMIGKKNPLSSEKFCGVFEVPEKLFNGEQMIWGTADEQAFYRFLSLKTIEGLNGIKICLIQDKNIGPDDSDRGPSEVQFYLQKKRARQPHPVPDVGETKPLRVGIFNRLSSTYQDVVISGEYNEPSSGAGGKPKEHVFFKLPTSFRTEGWMISNEVWCQTGFDLYSNRIGEFRFICPEISFKINFLAEVPEANQ